MVRGATQGAAASHNRHSIGVVLDRFEAREELAKVRGRSYAEQELHLTIVQYLRAALTRETFFLHVANERKCSEAEGALLKRLGQRKGFPDLLLIHAGRAFGMEIKPDGGRVRPEQREAHAALAEAGMPVVVVRSIADTGDALQAWGIPNRARPMGKLLA
jgi:hypothetical protein